MDGVARLIDAVGTAAEGEHDWAARLSAGLAAGLDFLAADPPLARRFLVEPLAASRSARLEHECHLTRLTQALRHPSVAPPGGAAISAETARLLAGGVVSHLSGRVLAGEAERLPESRDLLLSYLLAPSLSATPDAADPRAVCG